MVKKTKEKPQETSIPAPKSAKKARARKRKEKKVDYDGLEATEMNRSDLRTAERNANVFSWHYSEKASNSRRLKGSALQRQIAKYSHYDAINFAAETRIWSTNPKASGGKQDRVSFPPSSLPTSEDESSVIKAYYRVISDNGDRYTLMACHVNVHGFHRGDLRFVEVNDRTIVKGLDGKSVIGNLFLGDIVAVTKLNFISDDQTDFAINTFRVHQDSPPTWEVEKMTIMRRNWDDSLLFALLSNGNAVAKARDEVFTVQLADKNKPIDSNVDELYRGHAFIPEILRESFAQNYIHRRQYHLIAKASALPSYPNAFGTIFDFKMSPEDTRMFEIGTQAYKQKSHLSPEWIVETCALMGYSAANAVFHGRSDYRAFQMQNPSREGFIVKFAIANPWKQPTTGRWKTKNRIEFSGIQEDGEFFKINAVIETVIADTEKRLLHIAARISRDSPKNFKFNDDVYIVSQRISPDRLLLQDGFFSDLPKNSNGKRIIKTLYGAPSIVMPKFDNSQSYTFPTADNHVPLNRYQNQYVSMLIHGKTPLVVASSPFGCGKSRTIVTAAIEMQKLEQGSEEKHQMQLLVTQSNYASVNLVDIARNCEPRPKFVRFISESNCKELQENCLTEYDLPVLMRAFFAKINLEETLKTTTPAEGKAIVNYLISERLSQRDSLGETAKKIHDKMLRENGTMKLLNYKKLLKTFFARYKPDLIMVTADSVKNLLSTKVLQPGDVTTIQIDEASQVPEYTLLNLIVQFPDATFGLIGDIHQLPPYCEDQLTGKLKEYGIGNFMERAVHGKLFPIATLRYVYRCHPKTTELLSELFYDEELISGVTEKMRNEFMTKAPRTFWPNPVYPMIIVDNKAPGHRMGTSCGNKTEVQMVKQIVEYITKPFPNGYSIPPEDVGVISFYSAQTSVLTETMRGSRVKCGTVDSFQGSEREVIILCCTSDRISDFMQLPNRLNVAMSRARQATIVIGDVNGLKNAKFWSTVVERAEESGNLVDMSKQPFCPAGSEKTAVPNRKSTKVQVQHKNQLSAKRLAASMKALNVSTTDTAQKPREKETKKSQNPK